MEIQVLQNENSSQTNAYSHYSNNNNIHEKITRFWLAKSSAVQVQHQYKKCNTGAKSVTPVQITHRNSRSWLTERQKEIF